jgi:hypothetical protein
MKLTPKNSPALESIIRQGLNVSEASTLIHNYLLNEKYNLRPDALIRDGGQLYIVEITHTATWETISRLLLFQRLSGERPEIALAAKIIPETLYSAARELGVKLIHLPHDISVDYERTTPRGKITSKKAWKVITHLIRTGPCSIRSISQEENVSYAWTHKTIKSLLSRGIISQRGNNVEISDLETLFNAIAWERPLKSLQIDEITTSLSSTHDLAQTLTRAAEGWDKQIALAAYTAAAYQFGYGIRSDLVYCYVSTRQIGAILRNEFHDARLESGIKIIVLLSDRDVFADGDITDGVKITSRTQTLLDVAGLGYSGRDLLNNMVEQYGTHRD